MQPKSLKNTGPTSDDGETCERGPSPIPSELTLSVEDSPAKTFPMPGEGQELPGNEAGCFSRPFAWFDNSDPDSCCWRTWQRCLLEGWTLFSGRWGRSGMTQNGIAYRLPPLVPRISGTGCSWWGTPNSHPRTHTPRDVDHGIQLANQVAMYPTPYGLSANQGQGDGEFGKAIRNWPTPKGSPAICKPKDKATDSPGQLSPGFVEWLMGFPQFHTEISSHETQCRSQTSPKGVSEDNTKEVPAVRNDQAEAIREAPCGLHEAVGSRDPMPDVPCESRPRGGTEEDQTAESVQGLRDDVHAEPQHKARDLLKEVLISVGKTECYETMEGAFTQAELLELRDRVRAAKIQGGDVLGILREQARLEETPWANGEWPDQPRVETGVPHRVDRLRCLGNAVVPQVAEWIGKRIMEADSR